MLNCKIYESFGIIFSFGEEFNNYMDKIFITRGKYIEVYRNKYIRKCIIIRITQF